MSLISREDSLVPAPMCKEVPGPEEQAAGPPRAELSPSTESGGEDQLSDVDSSSSLILVHMIPRQEAQEQTTFMGSRRLLHQEPPDGGPVPTPTLPSISFLDAPSNLL